MGREVSKGYVDTLRGVAWDAGWDERVGKWKVWRLERLRDRLGRDRGENDVFESDEAAMEFVERLAKLGNEEAQGIMLKLAWQEDKEREYDLGEGGVGDGLDSVGCGSGDGGSLDGDVEVGLEGSEGEGGEGPGLF